MKINDKGSRWMELNDSARSRVNAGNNDRPLLPQSRVYACAKNMS